MVNGVQTRGAGAYAAVARRRGVLSAGVAGAARALTVAVRTGS